MDRKTARKRRKRIERDKQQEAHRQRRKYLCRIGFISQMTICRLPVNPDGSFEIPFDEQERKVA